SFGLSTGEIGTWLAVCCGLGGLAGSWLGGEWASRYAANNERLQLHAMSLAIVVGAVLSTCAYLAPNAYLAFILLGLSGMMLATSNGPLFATIQTLAPERMRAVAFAFVYLVANLIGMGLGPLAAGWLSDALRSWVGEESLRYSLLLLSPGYLCSAWLLLMAK